MKSKRSSHYANWRFNSTETQFTKMSWTYNVTHHMVDKNVTLLENGATHLQDNGDVRFYHSARAL